MTIPMWAFILFIIFSAIGVITLVAILGSLIVGIVDYREFKKNQSKYE